MFIVPNPAWQTAYQNIHPFYRGKNGNMHMGLVVSPCHTVGVPSCNVKQYTTCVLAKKPQMYYLLSSKSGGHSSLRLSLLWRVVLNPVESCPSWILASR